MERTRKAASATGQVTDEQMVPIQGEKELRSGMHISPTALVQLWTDSQTQKTDVRRASVFVHMLRDSSAEEVKDALRGPSESEKTQAKDEGGKAYGPFITEALDNGITLSSARVYLSNMRAVKAAYELGALTAYIPESGKIDDSKIPGWHELVRQSVRAKEQRTEYSRNLRETQAQSEIRDEIIAKLGGWDNLTPEQFMEIQDQAKAERAKILDQEFHKKESDQIIAAVDRLMGKGTDYSTAVLKGLAQRLGYNLHKMTKAERKAAERGNVNVVESDSDVVEERSAVH